MDHRERFLAVMEYRPVDRVPNWEIGVWPQTRERWASEGLDPLTLHWDWIDGEAALGMDPREYIVFNGQPVPLFEKEVLEEDERTQVIRDERGRVRRQLKEGMIDGETISMDQYLRFPVENMADWQEMKKRHDPTCPQRYEPNWRTLRVEGWRNRKHPLVFARHGHTKGFYWIARELMGTEGVSYAWYDQPELMHDMMNFWADFLIEGARPVLEATTVEYIFLIEDMAMKTAPLISPDLYRRFILPPLERTLGFLKSHGVRYIIVDTDGNPEALIPIMMDAGVDALWPLERAADQDPLRLRRTYGRSLRLWGGVDKRELARGPEAIDAHLRTLVPLIEEGGFIPTVDHAVSPDISWPNFRYYLDSKMKLLRGGAC